MQQWVTGPSDRPPRGERTTRRLPHSQYGSTTRLRPQPPSRTDLLWQQYGLQGGVDSVDTGVPANLPLPEYLHNQECYFVLQEEGNTHKKFCLRILIKNPTHLHNSLPSLLPSRRRYGTFKSTTNRQITTWPLNCCIARAQHTLATMNMHTIQHTHTVVCHTYTTQLSVTNMYHAAYHHHCCTLFLHPVMHAAPYVHLFLFFIHIIIQYCLYSFMQCIIIAVHFILIMYYLWLSAKEFQ